MPTDKRPLKIFLCHAHADRDAVRALYVRLIKDGVEAWLDKENLLPGQDWELEIRKAVRESDVVVVCLSKQFNQAGFRQKEVRLALDTAVEKPEGEIFIIPARLEECDTLESLRKWHWVDLFEENGYAMLMWALRTRADKIRATLQVKKSRFSKVDTRPTVVKKASLPIEKPVEKKQEKHQPRRNIQISGIFNKTIISISGFIIFVLIVLFGLRPLIGQLEPTPISTNTTSLKTFTSIPLSKTPTFTSTITLTVTPVLPKWLVALSTNPILPGFGMAGIRIGDQETTIVESLGEPSQAKPVDNTGSGPAYVLTYEFAGVELVFFLNSESKKVEMIRAIDDNFNKDEYIPRVNGISIGSRKDELISIFGEPNHNPYNDAYGCPSLGKIGTFGYGNIGFWVCDNNKIYLIDIPSPY